MRKVSLSTTLWIVTAIFLLLIIFADRRKSEREIKALQVQIEGLIAKNQIQIRSTDYADIEIPVGDDGDIGKAVQRHMFGKDFEK